MLKKLTFTIFLACLSFYAFSQEEISNQEKAEPAEKPVEKEYIPLTLSGAQRPEVEKYRQQYLKASWSKKLYSDLEEAINYRLYVRKALEDNNMPPELEYLPMVESNYKTHALSKSGARGIWQFMENSVKPFLTLNEYIDERLDPWKATDAAIKKLKDNYNMFQDWHLAIAAYNCGAGAMQRALKKAPEKNYWYLVEHKLIPEQTRNYIPKLLALADIATNSEYYNINIPSHQKEYESLYNEKNAIFDYIEVDKAYSISQLAQEMRIDGKTLKELNLSFIKGFTHPSQKSTIRLPLGTKESAATALSKMKTLNFPISYKVKKGDSLWSISKKFGISIEELCQINDINENAILRVGKILYIPSK